MKSLPLSGAAGAPPRAGLRAHAGLWAWRHGLWLPLALLLLAGAGAMVWDAQEVARRAEAARSLPPAPAAAAAPATAEASAQAARVAALRALLPPAGEATAQVRRLVELTRPQLAWQRAEFQHSEDAAGGLLRLQVTVPVAGEYAAMRQALDKALLALPNLSLDQVLLHRVQPDATKLEARLRFSIWLASAEKAPAR